jgi:hypothetical protein
MTSNHQIGPVLPGVARPSTARIGAWTGAGLLTGGCLGGLYGLVAGLATGPYLAGFAIAAGMTIGLILGSVTGFLIGLAQVLVRRHPSIPVPLIAVTVTELVLLAPQILSIRAGWHVAALSTGFPSVISLGTAAVLALCLPPGRRPLRRPRTRGDVRSYGATGLRLRAYQRRRLTGSGPRRRPC